MLIGLVSVGVAAFSYALASMGVVAAIIELGRESVKGLRDTALIAARAMPPMLAVLLFLFLATEVWQTLGVVEGWRFGVVFTSFLVMSTTFLLGGLRGYRRGLVDSKPTPALAERAARTPAARLVSEGVTPVFPPLGRLARINLAVALLVSLGVRIAAVGLAIGVFLIGFGMLMVTRSTTASWTGLPAGDLNVLLSISVAGNDIVLTEPLVRVSVLLGAFAALYSRWRRSPTNATGGSSSTTSSSASKTPWPRGRTTEERSARRRRRPPAHQPRRTACRV